MRDQALQIVVEEAPRHLPVDEADVDVHAGVLPQDRDRLLQEGPAGVHEVHPQLRVPLQEGLEKERVAEAGRVVGQPRAGRGHVDAHRHVVGHRELPDPVRLRRVRREALVLRHELADRDDPTGLHERAHAIVLEVRHAGLDRGEDPVARVHPAAELGGVLRHRDRVHVVALQVCERPRHQLRPVRGRLERIDAEGLPVLVHEVDPPRERAVGALRRSAVRVRVDVEDGIAAALPRRGRRRAERQHSRQR